MARSKKKNLSTETNGFGTQTEKSRSEYLERCILVRGSEWGYFDNAKHLFFWLYNIKQLIFSHFNTNIKKFVVTLFFSHKQTNHTLKGEMSMLGLCLLSQRGFFGHFPTIRDYFKTSEEWGRYPKAAEDFRKLSKMSEGCRRCPNTAEDVQRLPKMSSETAKDVHRLMTDDIWRLPQIWLV